MRHRSCGAGDHSARPDCFGAYPGGEPLCESVDCPETRHRALGKTRSMGLAHRRHGDCEDYQLLKRKLLVEAGLPCRAMRMTVVIDDIDEGHAVLTVRTDAGDLILDNKVDAVLPWQEVKYEFIKRESSRSAEWLFLEREERTDMIAMAR